MKAQTILSILILSILMFFASSCFGSLGECTSGDCYDKVGTFNFPNDEIYEGVWEGGRQHSVGTWFFPESSMSSGQFKNGKYNRVGTFSWPDDVKYTGQWKDGRKKRNRYDVIPLWQKIKRKIHFQ